MNEKETNAGQNEVETAVDTQVEEPKTTTDETTSATEEVETPTETTSEELEKTFNQKQVDEIIGNRVKRIFKRYGVEDKNGLDELVGKAQSYDIMRERYDALTNENAQLKEKIAFLENNINPERQEDIRAYFKGKDMEFSNDNLKTELQTHPEWLKVAEKSNTPITTIEKLSPERGKVEAEESEESQWKKLFGFN